MRGCDDMALTAKMERFCQEFLVDMNATKAAIRAGYSEKTAHVIGQENLRKPVIMERLAELQQKTLHKLEVTRERIMEEYAKIGFSDITDYLEVEEYDAKDYDNGGFRKETRVIIHPTEDMPKRKTAAIAEVRQTKEGIAIKLHDKKGALDSMARYLGMFKDKLEVTGSMRTEILHDLKKLDRKELAQLETIINKSADTGGSEES
jgi:phage terminase small subunit